MYFSDYFQWGTMKLLHLYQLLGGLSLHLNHLIA